MKESKIAVPGEKVCIIEEFLPGKGARQSADGIVYATVVGRLLYDMRKREVSVKPMKELDSISTGDIVLGEVKELQSKMAVIRLMGKNGRGLKYPQTAMLLADAKSGALDNHIGIGDIIIGKVSQIHLDMIYISIWEHGLGVVLAVCDHCGMLMERYQRERDKYNLLCPKCGRKGSRKIVNYYGVVKKLYSWLGFRHEGGDS